jgi:hypothetical protein
MRERNKLNRFQLLCWKVREVLNLVTGELDAFNAPAKPNSYDL